MTLQEVTSKKTHDKVAKLAGYEKANFHNYNVFGDLMYKVYNGPFLTPTSESWVTIVLPQFEIKS